LLHTVGFFFFFLSKSYLWPSRIRQTRETDRRERQTGRQRERGRGRESARARLSKHLVSVPAVTLFERGGGRFVVYWALALW
jgi:hypothetical protein